ncbi:hypothetical protein N7468_002822 [Penicillium chermesinum]|uniref:DUF202 domain-containing protein n=1 Tax=Penicillium chermesinum TaxID=63820 RepID=A0A9W9TZZ3_9EURO|nr:uncharacterized protein N7468_002822 [Penicillium chermesinum]KAJ5247839.1 hypothetical protein N7468_002822 [Penicillium chermesinum]KAJ6151600.1 hypothetical protein N7470_007197 [Penicillium chermesinum]
MSSLERPSTAIVRDSSRPEPADDQLLELHQIQTHEDDEFAYSSPSASSGDDCRGAVRQITRTTTQGSQRGSSGPWRRLCRFWTHHVTLTVPQKSNRDHLALERTFLAYIRTSVAIAMQGVVIAQLFRLQRSPMKEDRLKFYDVGIPLAVTCHAVAVVVALIGAYRFWRQQSAISRAKVHAGGWELNSVGILLFGIILATLVLTVAIIVEIEKASGSLLRRLTNR